MYHEVERRRATKTLASGIMNFSIVGADLRLGYEAPVDGRDLINQLSANTEEGARRSRTEYGLSKLVEQAGFNDGYRKAGLCKSDADRIAACAAANNDIVVAIGLQLVSQRGVKLRSYETLPLVNTKHSLDSTKCSFDQTTTRDNGTQTVLEWIQQRIQESCSNQMCCIGESKGQRQETKRPMEKHIADCQMSSLSQAKSTHATMYYVIRMYMIWAFESSFLGLLISLVCHINWPKSILAMLPVLSTQGMSPNVVS